MNTRMKFLVCALGIACAVIVAFTSGCLMFALGAATGPAALGIGASACATTLVLFFAGVAAFK
ncbi:hypothetical protein ACU686_12455 [Yinghuangia aomiensis]